MKKIFKGKTGLILLGLITGILFGFILKIVPEGMIRDTILVDGVLRLVGSGFINLIKMIVVPLVFFSLICGISSLGDIHKLNRIGGKTISFYLVTTGVAVTIAIGLGLAMNPGKGLDMSSLMMGEFTIPESKGLVDILLGMIPTNPVQALTTGNMLQIIVFAVMFGVALSLIGEKGNPIIKACNIINDTIMQLVSMIMAIAPFGIFALISRTVYSIGFESLLKVAEFIGVVALAMLAHAFIVYGGMLKLFTGLPLKQFYKAYAKVASVTFSTSSSSATLPLSMETMEDLGVEKTVYSFALPLGATINMDGTAIMQGVATIFIAQIYGIELGIGAILTVILTAVLASVGTAGVPGVGMITLSMVLQSAGLPVEGIALIIGFDRILDMMRTTVNVMGDCVCSLIVSKTEKSLDEKKYLSYK